MKVFLMAIGAHPDDVELGCAGTIYNHVQQDQSVAIVDLTEGELGSRGTVGTRYAEAEAAREILKVDHRYNLKMADGFFEHNKENLMKLIEIIRLHQPEVILANAPEDRHPDHGRACKLISDAAFLSGLRKIDSSYNGIAQGPWRPKRVFHYIQDRFLEPDFIVDISESMDTKMRSVKAYSTQFFSDPADDGPVTYISSDSFLTKIQNRAAQLGARIGAAYGEGFISPSNIGIKDLNQLIYPEMS